MIFNKEIECMSRKNMEQLQLKRLQNIVYYCYEKVPFYKAKFDAVNLKPKDIKELKDIEKIPFTTKEDLRDNYPFDMFAVPMKEIVETHASSGTTGKPVVVGYTKNDLETWSEAVARLAAAAGVTSEDVAQVAFGYGMFTGGFGLHYGLQKLGATVIPASAGNSERQLMYMQDFKTTVLISTPSYALYLSEICEDMGIDPKSLSLKIGLFGGEGHSDELTKEVEKRWGIIDTENYGMTEITGPGVSGECTHKTGMHICEDLFYPEIIDSTTEKQLPIGEKGEMVLTTLVKEGIPMLRFRTKDITILDDKPCQCGRTSIRMHKIFGRSDDMLIIKGVNVFPSQIESVLMKFDKIAPHYQILLKSHGFMDTIEVLVEVENGDILDSYRKLEQLEKDIRHEIRTVLQIDATIKLVEPKTLERTEGKSKRVVDMRNKKQY
ncbi:MAG: phenylacetate--CoA ligase [Clostridiales bacterium]|nr:phenylacetate--CoA ligase [Clostridiales bacterium]